jgi:hypothetical protein
MITPGEVVGLKGAEHIAEGVVVEENGAPNY